MRLQAIDACLRLVHRHSSLLRRVCEAISGRGVDPSLHYVLVFYGYRSLRDYTPEAVGARGALGALRLVAV